MADSYKIVSQSQTQELDPAGGGFVDMWNIRYQVTSGPAKGTTATVQVRNEDHTADVVQKAIEDKIATLSAIGNLGGLGNAGMAW